MTARHSEKYIQYLQSSEWRKKRTSVIAQSGAQCSRCRRFFAGGNGLEVHHKTYDRLGREWPSDLEVVCIRCHPKADEQRRVIVAAKQYDRRVDAWAEKRYGENWSSYKNEEDVSDAFDDWLERRGYD